MNSIDKKTPVIIIGAGKHGQLIAEKILEDPALVLKGFIEKEAGVLPPFLARKGYKVIGNDADLLLFRDEACFCLALGSDLMSARKRIINTIEKEKLYVFGIIHPTAYIANSAVLGKGCTVLVHGVVHTNAVLGNFSCINTGAIVEHDCRIGKNVFIQPNAVLAGNVTVGDNTTVGIGATVREKITIGSGCVIGGGAFVCKDIPDNSIAYGVPARIMGKNVF